jgi:5-methylcytosine-specific restriction endonuclease McrA
MSNSQPKTKVCNDCGKRKSRNKFGVSKRASDGIRQPCKKCRELETERGKERKQAYDKQYRIDNEEKIKKDQAQRRIDNREYYIEYGNKRRKMPGHKEAMSVYHKAYYVENQEAIKAKVNKHRVENREDINQKSRERQANETPKQRKDRLAYHRKRYAETDKTAPEYKAMKSYHSSIRRMRVRNVESDGHTIPELHEYWRSKGIDPKYCTYCDKYYRKWQSSVGDHVIPITKGGGDVMENIVPCCGPCNNSKFNRILYVEWIPPNERLAA